jgi:hypothetical protein
VVSIEFVFEQQLNFYHGYARNARAQLSLKVRAWLLNKPKNRQREERIHDVFVSGCYGRTSCAKNWDSSALSPNRRQIVFRTLCNEN